MQVFSCQKFDDEWFLRAELTLACDGSDRRNKWIAYASFCTAIYPIGVPLLIFSLMYTRRNEITRLQQALKLNDSQQTALISAGKLAKQESTKERRPSIVASVEHTLVWIVKKFERYNPGRWYTGVFLLLLRILQTSVLVLVPRQNLQVGAPRIPYCVE